jgi:hypothetical protein
MHGQVEDNRRLLMNESSLRYEGWRVAIAGSVGVFLASLIAYTFGIFLKPWSRDSERSRPKP